MRNNTPCRLHKVEPKKSFDDICMTIAPYVIFVAIVAIVILALVIMMKYGGAWFGTEANRFYYGGI